MRKSSKKEDKKELKENKVDENKKVGSEIANDKKIDDKSDEIKDDLKKSNAQNDIKLKISSWKIKNSIPEGVMKSFLSKNNLDESKKYDESELDKKYNEFLESPIKED